MGLKGVQKYKEFHALEPREIGTFPSSVVIPKVAYCLGPAVDIAYRSWKWGETAEYIHKFDPGVKAYSVQAGGADRRVPNYIRRESVLVKLGSCLFFSFEDPTEGGLLEERFGRSPPGLFTIPSGRCLVVISARRVEALIWGGKLNVKDVGIVH